MSEDETPHDPVFDAVLVLSDTFPDFLECLHGVAVFKDREGPVPMRIMHMLIMLFRFLTNVDGVSVQLEHIEQESQVVVRVRMCRFQINHLLKVVFRRLVKLKLKVAQA